MSEFAGSLRTRVEVWQRLETRTPSGLEVDEWDLVCRCLASIEADGFGPVEEGMTLSSLPRFRVAMRSRDDVRIDQRVHWNQRRLAVRQIVSDPAKPDRMVLRCEELRA